MAYVSPAGMSLEDPVMPHIHNPSEQAQHDAFVPTHVHIAVGKHARGVPLEDMLHYARLQRMSEDNGLEGIEEAGIVPVNDPSQKRNLFRRKKEKTNETTSKGETTSNGVNANVTTYPEEKNGIHTPPEKKSDDGHEKQGVRVSVADLYGNTETLTGDDLERINARRALRQAHWAAVFYLITTDILGPFNAPFAISQVGYVPGVLLYFFMGCIAFYTGVLISQMYGKLDSDRFPVKTYGDLGERIFGIWMRHIVTILQTIQLIINVGTLCLGNGQALYQITQGPSHTAGLCFIVCIVIWIGVGLVIGQIRSLKNFGLLANSAVYINLLIIFLSMGFVAHSPPNYAAAQSSQGVEMGPIITQTFVSLPLASKVNGIMQMVFAYGGAMIFPEIMAEMRRPMDFWKGMACAQALIFSCYLLYGVFVYAFQGQFTLPLAYQGVSKYSWQTVGNVLSLITGIIAAGLYGNIGLKVVYINIVEDWFNGPPLLTTKGRVIWSGMTVVYWGLAFVIGAAIPQIQTISALVAAVCIMQFTYSFPLLFKFMFDVLLDAMEGDGKHVPGTPPQPVDTWREWSRWKRGLFGGRWYFKWFNLILSLGAFAMAGLGMYGAGESIKSTFQNGQSTSFSCTGPV